MHLQLELFFNDLKAAVRSLWSAKGLSITVILTLALGIGANTTIFTLVRGILLRPLVNRGEDRLIYIRQSAPGIGSANTYFSVPELKDIESGAHSVSQFGDFSTISFTMVGLGEPREVQAGVVADVDDMHVIQMPTLTIYSPMAQQGLFAARLFVHTHNDPYGLVTPIVKLVRDMSADQPIEKAATLEDIRAEVLTPDRLNSLVFGGFAIVALAIAVVGVSGVLAFSVSARTREFGIRLAVGSQPSRLLTGVIREGAIMAAVGIAAGVVFGFALARAASALILLAAVAASALPALRASRVDVIQALRSE